MGIKFMKNFLKKYKMPKQVGWLIPGLEVKRWFLISFIGLLLLCFGAMVLWNMEPLIFLFGWLKEFAKTVPTNIAAVIFIIVGVFLFIKGWQNTNYSMFDINDDREKNAVLENLYKKRKLNRGPKIVAVGGGTGLSTLLLGIKKYTNNITAIVSVGDDGGSSGRLREELGILPPGDIRHCITALADDEDLVNKLFKYRFDNGEGLEGHSFGNLFITAMCDITGDMVRAVKESSKVLSIRGRVLPATLDDMRLAAEMDDGTIVHGESNISEAGKKIKRLFSEPADCKALEDVLVAIAQADLIILGPGSLYTSVIPNLLVKEISQAIAASKAKKIYVCNVMTQPGETDNYSVSDHLNALIQHSGSNKIVDTVMVNDYLPKQSLEVYQAKNSYPVKIDEDVIKKMGIKIYKKCVINLEEGKFLRHSPRNLARAIYVWYRRQGK